MSTLHPSRFSGAAARRVAVLALLAILLGWLPATVRAGLAAATGEVAWLIQADGEQPAKPEASRAWRGGKLAASASPTPPVDALPPAARPVSWPPAAAPDRPLAPVSGASLADLRLRPAPTGPPSRA